MLGTKSGFKLCAEFCEASKVRNRQFTETNGIFTAYYTCMLARLRWIQKFSHTSAPPCGDILLSTQRMIQTAGLPSSYKHTVVNELLVYVCIIFSVSNYMIQAGQI